VRVLVIDDSRAIRSIISRSLKELAFEVVEAANGREGMERLKDMSPFDLALVDWNMPEMNGYEFLCAVRKDSTRSGMSIMMITTETETEQMAKALEAGANEYLMKPFTKEALCDKLKLLGAIKPPV